VRQDPLAARIALGHFIEATLRLCLLLEGDYTPYWKWLAFAFRATRSAARLELPLRQLAEASSWQEQGNLVQQVCAVVHKLLEEAELAGQDQSLHPHPLFCDQVAVRQRIEREQAATGE
jgi:hypothetical protein